VKPWSLGLGVLFLALAWRIATFEVPADLLDSTRNILWNLKVSTYHAALASEHLETVTKELADPRAGIARTLRNVNTVTAQLGRTSNVARLAASEQRKYFQDLSAESVKTLRAANGLIERADQQVNDGTLPALTADLAQLKVSLESLQKDGHETLSAASGTLQAAGVLLADPSIPEATKSLASAAKHIDGGTAHAEKSMEYVEASLKPTKRSFWKGLAQSLVPAAVRVLWNLLFPERVVVVK